MEPMSGNVKWSENSNVGYFAQDHSELFECDLNVFEWIGQWRQPSDDEQSLRAVLGRLLFSRERFDQPVRAASGGEQARLLFARLMLQKPNVMLMDEPTNHLDMESIEALNLALEHYPRNADFRKSRSPVCVFARDSNHRTYADWNDRLWRRL